MEVLPFPCESLHRVVEGVGLPPFKIILLWLSSRSIRFELEGFYLALIELFPHGKRLALPAAFDVCQVDADGSTFLLHVSNHHVCHGRLSWSRSVKSVHELDFFQGNMFQRFQLIPAFHQAFDDLGAIQCIVEELHWAYLEIEVLQTGWKKPWQR